MTSSRDEFHSCSQKRNEIHFQVEKSVYIQHDNNYSFQPRDNYKKFLGDDLVARGICF